jgi:glycosyltransferase involved in cell wall biosynthesis
VIPNPVDVNKFKLVDKKTNGIRRILHVSSLLPVKGITDLINAVSILCKKRKDFIVDIVGGTKDRVNDYKKMVKDKGLEDIVNYSGIKTNTEIIHYMQFCDFFVFPSLKESFGVVLIEAMACGKPVIATCSGGPEEIVNKDNGILIPTQDIKALVETFDYMLDNYQEFNSEKIREYIINNYSYKAVSKTLNRTYLRLQE